MNRRQSSRFVLSIALLMSLAGIMVGRGAQAAPLADWPNKLAIAPLRVAQVQSSAPTVPTTSPPAWLWWLLPIGGGALATPWVLKKAAAKAKQPEIEPAGYVVAEQEATTGSPATAEPTTQTTTISAPPTIASPPVQAASRSSVAATPLNLAAIAAPVSADAPEQAPEQADQSSESGSESVQVAQTLQTIAPVEPSTPEPELTTPEPVTEPVVEPVAEPVVIVGSQPELIAEPQPEPVQPVAVAVPEPESIAPEPEPIAATTPEPEPIAPEPEPIAATTPEPEPIAPEPEPIAATTPEPEPIAPVSASPATPATFDRAQERVEAAKFDVAGATPLPLTTVDRPQERVEAAKFDVGQEDLTGVVPVGSSLSAQDLANVDDDLPDLPEGYGDTRIVLLPRDSQWAYAYWDAPNAHRESLRRQGGERLALRLYDVTDIDINQQRPHSLQQFECDELAREWYVPIPVSDRDYLAELGYLTAQGDWLVLARSAPVRIPPVYPSDWQEESWVTVNWDDDLRGGEVLNLGSAQRPPTNEPTLHERLYALSLGGAAARSTGSFFGSQQRVPGSQVPSSHVHGSQVPGSLHQASSLSSYVFPSGLAGWALPTASGAAPNVSGLTGYGSGQNVSGLNVSGLNMSGLNVSGLNMSGLNMSGLNVSGLNMSGVGWSGSAIPLRPRKFWLVADAELIVYGATESDATVTIAGRPIQLEPDGTFRVHVHFPDGTIDYPIFATAVDGEQSRSIHLHFERQTPSQNTNTPDQAIDEWPKA